MCMSRARPPNSASRRGTTTAKPDPDRGACRAGRASLEGARWRGRPANRRAHGRERQSASLVRDQAKRLLQSARDGEDAGRAAGGIGRLCLDHRRRWMVGRAGRAAADRHRQEILQAGRCGQSADRDRRSEHAGAGDGEGPRTVHEASRESAAAVGDGRDSDPRRVHAEFLCQRHGCSRRRSCIRDRRACRSRPPISN